MMSPVFFKKKISHILKHTSWMKLGAKNLNQTNVVIVNIARIMLCYKMSTNFILDQNLF